MAHTTKPETGVSHSPEFIEAIARGLEVLRSFGSTPRPMTLAEVASATGLTRPTSRRILITLAELGYVRIDGRAFSLTPRVLELGTAYVESSGLWELARPRLEDLVRATGQSCSVAQLDGSDIVYVARVAVPKLVTLSVRIGTRFPARVTSLGKVLLASLPTQELDHVLAIPSRADVQPTADVDDTALRDELRAVRARGWALTDQQLGPGIRSVATGVRNGAGDVVAAMNVNAHAPETPVSELKEIYLPSLMHAAGELSADLARLDRLPTLSLSPNAGRVGAVRA